MLVMTLLVVDVSATKAMGITSIAICYPKRVSVRTFFTIIVCRPIDALFTALLQGTVAVGSCSGRITQTSELDHRPMKYNSLPIKHVWLRGVFRPRTYEL